MRGLVAGAVVASLLMVAASPVAAQAPIPPTAPADGAGLLPGLDARLVGSTLAYGSSATDVDALRAVQARLDALIQEQATLRERQLGLTQSLEWLDRVQQAAAAELIDAETNLRRLTSLVYTQGNAGWQVTAFFDTGNVMEAERAQHLGGSLGDQLVVAKRRARIARKVASWAAADLAVQRVDVDTRLGQVEQVELPSAKREVAALSVHAAATLAGAAVEPLGIPLASLDAYLRAERALRAERPTCGLAWWMLAGIGRVESNHGRYGGAQPALHGNVTPRIIGIALDGGPGVGTIPDTDRGAWDGDARWDRAVGPMQFIPSTWRHYRADGNGDGVTDPNNLYDASVGAGRYLCTAAGRLDGDASLTRAYLAYNSSTAYAARVLDLARAYEATGLPRSA